MPRKDPQRPRQRRAALPRGRVAAGAAQGRSPRGIRHVLTILGEPSTSGPRPAPAAPPTTPVPPAARRARHRDAVLAAERRRLVRLTRAFGPLSRTQLARLAHAERWREGGFDAAVESAIAHGELRRLAFGYVATPRPEEADADAVSPSRSAARPG